MWITKSGASKDFYDPEELRSFLDGLFLTDSSTSTPHRGAMAADQNAPSQELAPGGSDVWTVKASLEVSLSYLVHRRCSEGLRPRTPKVTGSELILHPVVLIACASLEAASSPLLTWHLAVIMGGASLDGSADPLLTWHPAVIMGSASLDGLVDPLLTCHPVVIMGGASLDGSADPLLTRHPAVIMGGASLDGSADPLLT
ncbi:hypothetical protein NDU88_007515 [Pleurodeles waltl]|uniref:Uncharacterized protein n=1 Tax=Pleurodeles waltl TaxID=8319 RepID=A0AAV7LS99_PLEWA|nr:hypothetical protein NDU88_007515 [Pleurodeles waltl]